MGGKRIIVDHQHAMRQHKAFAIMVIVLLLVVFAVWFIQIRLMVRNVDFSQLQQDVVDAQNSFQGAFDQVDTAIIDESATAAATMVGDAVAEAQAALDADEQARNEVAARAAALLETEDATPTPDEPSSDTVPSTTDAQTITE